MISKTLCRAQTYVGQGIYGDSLVNDPAPLSLGDCDFPNGNLHVSIVGTSATVVIYGRTVPTLPWRVLATISASGVTSVVMLAEMYAAITAISAAVVDVAINYPNC
jgi:hypothetical protein